MIRKTSILVAMCVVAGLAAAPVHAACAAPTPMTNLSAYPIFNCPDGKPAIAYAYQPGAAVPTNTGTNDIICEADQGTAPCNTMPGGLNNLNDGIVAISTDWSNPGINGCPNGRVVIELQCNDGRGALLSLSGGCSALGYNPEGAYGFDGNIIALDLGPAPDPLLNKPLSNGRAKVLSFARVGGMDQIHVQVDAPILQSDCDPTSFAQANVGAGNCTDTDFNCAALPVYGRGGLYTSVQPCSTNDSRPANLVRGPVWVAQALDAAGQAMLNLPVPPAGQCNFVGTSAKTGTFESLNITGFVATGGATANKPVAEGVRAAKKGNSIEVAFSTSSELGLLGFNIYAAGKAKGELKLNAGMIAAKGVGGGGASYSESYSMSEFKGNRGIIVESVLTDGSTLRAGRIDF